MSETEPGPYELWVEARGDSAEGSSEHVERYRQLMRDHKYVLVPGDEGYEEAQSSLPCGWPVKRLTEGP